MMIKTVVFDLDNTLYNYDAAHETAFGAVTDYAGKTFGLPPEAFATLHRQADQKLRAHTGRLCAAVHNRLIRYQLILEQMGRPLRYAPEMANCYWSAFLDHMQPFPDAADCLAALRAAGRLTGVGTNMTADYQFAKLKRLGLLDSIDFLVTSEEAGAEKPDGRLFACCVEKARCRPEECLFVGDQLEADVRGAQKASLRGVWFRPGEDPAPDVLHIRTLGQLPDLLRTLDAGPP